ncbi:MAG: hypothetical protein ACWA40_00050 [Planktomarina sp.]
MTFRFLALMLFGSGLGFLKIIGLAVVLEAADFGNYITAISSAALASLLISFGKVEATTKEFPRYWENQTYGTAWKRSFGIARILLLRCGGLGLSLLGASFFVPVLPTWPVLCIWVGLVLCTNLITLVTSLIRGIGDIKLIQNFTLMRGGVIFCAVMPMVFVANWQIILLTELGATALVVAIGFWGAWRTSGPQRGTKAVTQNSPSTTHKDGRTLFFANSLSGTITLGDKSFINAAMGTAMAGAYGTVGLATQMGQLLTGLMSQKVGPDIIKSIHTDQGLPHAMRLMRLPIALVITAALLLAAITFGAKSFIPVVEAFFAARSITNTAITLGAVAMVLQLYLLIEFVVLAYDKETSLMRSSACAAALCYLCMTAAWQFSAPLEYFIGAVVLGRMVHITCLWRIIKRLPHHKHSAT